MKHKINGRLFSLLLSALILSGTPNLRAATYTWTKLGPVDSAWSDPTNWQNGLAPVGSTSADTVQFFANNTIAMTGNVSGTNDIASPLVANRFILSGAGYTTAYTVTLKGADIQLAGTSPQLKLDGRGVTADLTYDIYNNFQLTGSASIWGSSWGINNLRGAFTGTGPLSINAGCKNLLLYGASTYTGATSLTYGTLYMAANNALPATTDLTISSGALLDLNSPFGGSAGGNLTVNSLSGSGELGNNNNSTTRTLTISGGGAGTFDGKLSAGSGTPNYTRLNVAVTGNSELTLTGTTHSYTGTTTISNGGVLAVDGKLATTPVTVNSGGILCGTGTVPGSVTLNSGGTIAAGDATIGTLTTGTQTWNSGAHVSWAINSGTGTAGTNWDQINSNGALVISATSSNPAVIDVSTMALSGTAGPMANFDPWRSGTWAMITATNGISGFSLNSLAINTAGIQNAFYSHNLPMGEFTLSSTGNQIKMTYTQGAMPAMGIYVGGRDAWKIVDFETYLGHPIGRTVCCNDYKSDWSGWLSSLDYLVYGTVGWQNTRYEPTISLCMMPWSTTSGTYTLLSGSAGTYNTYWTQAAQKLISKGLGNVVVRVGWEMNGNWFPWKANNAADAASYIGYWQQIVTTMRAQPGANFKFEWCPALGQQSFKPSNMYPGDAYVDIIGVDVYNKNFNLPLPNPEVFWNSIFPGNYGVQWFTNLAISHGKKLSFPEWATGWDASWAGGNTYGGGDDPFFIRKMYDWISTHSDLIAYHSYWDVDSTYYSKIDGSSHFPRVATVFKECFGQEQYWDQEIGSTGIPGTSSYDAPSKSYTVKGSGLGISGTDDSFHFLFTPKESNHTITAKITAIGSTGSGAVGGVMMRESYNTSGTTRYVFTGMNNGNVVFKYRDTRGAASVTTYTAASSLPVWVRLARSGTAYDQFTGSISTDGTTWTTIASQSITMNKDVNSGVALASGSNSVVNTSTFASVNEPIEIIQDNTDASGVAITGAWVSGTGKSCYGSNYIHDNNLNKGALSVQFTPTIPEAGNYNTYIWFPTLTSGTVSNPVPVTIVSGTGTVTQNVDQSWGGGNWILLGTFPFNAGTSGSVLVSNTNTTLKVAADAVRFYKAP